MKADFEQRLATTRNMECQMALQRRKMSAFESARPKEDQQTKVSSVRFTMACHVYLPAFKLVVPDSRHLNGAFLLHSCLISGTEIVNMPFFDWNIFHDFMHSKACRATYLTETKAACTKSSL
jgi:hypothetical protein